MVILHQGSEGKPPMRLFAFGLVGVAAMEAFRYGEGAVLTRKGAGFGSGPRSNASGCRDKLADQFYGRGSVFAIAIRADRVRP